MFAWMLMLVMCFKYATVNASIFASVNNHLQCHFITALSVDNLGICKTIWPDIEKLKIEERHMKALDRGYISD